METTIGLGFRGLGLRVNIGKENGNYHRFRVSGFRVNIGKENGNYHRFRV